MGRLEAEAGGEECWKGHGKPGKYEFNILLLYSTTIGMEHHVSKIRRAENQTTIKNSSFQEDVMLAGRNVGLFVGVLTMGGK